MQITIDTDAPISVTDRKILNLLLGGEVTSEVVTEPAVKPATPAKRPTTPKPEPEPEPEPEEDLIGGEPTVQDAVDAATALVNSGGASKVKAALKSIGSERVSNIPQGKVQAFLDALEG